MILYSLAAGGVSIGALFAAGLVPGLLLGASLLIATYVTSRRRNYPKGEFVGMKQVPKILRDGLLGLMAPVIIIGGILSGIFTATESAAVACMYAMVITFGVYREIPLSAMGGIVRRSFYTLAVISFLIASASAFGYMLSILRLPTAMTTALIGLTDNPIAILILVLLIMLGFGLIMDMAPLILILTPILLPVVEAVGMDPVHFGIVLVFTLALGLITPPVGTVLFVGSAVSGASVESITKALLPFYIPMVVVLLLVTFVPAFTLALPGLVGF
jgi:tripartite ATP-independent transporter DctM subunit